MAVGEIVVSFAADTASFETDTKRASDALVKAEKLVKQLNKAMADSHQASADFIGPLQPSRLRPATDGIERLNSAVQKSQAAFRGSNQVVQQASYQITDFVMQVSGGVSAMRAFSQQAPQLLGAFGAGGAALGLVAALGGAIGDLVMKSMDVKTAADRFKELDDATSTLAGTLNLVSQVDLSTLGKNYREATEDGKLLIDANVTLNMLLLDMAKIDALATFRQGIKEAIADANAFKLSMIDIVDRLIPAFKQAAAKPGDISGFVKSDERTFASLKNTTKEVAAEVDRLNKAFGEGKMLPGEYAKGLGKLIAIPANRTKELVDYVTQEQAYANKIARAISEGTAYGGAQAGGYKGLEKSPATRSTGMSSAEKLAKQELASADKFIDALQRQTDQLAFNKNLIGMTTQEVELLNAQYNVQAELTKTIQDMERQGITISAANMESMKAAAAQAIEAQTAIITAAQDRQRMGAFGMEESIRKYTDNAGNMAKHMEGAFTSAFKGMEDGLVQFALTGKASFADFANSVLAMVMRIQIQMMLAGLVKSVATAWAAPGATTGDGTRLETGGAMANGQAHGGWVPYAEGGYTGDGGKYEPKGVVHGGEFVFTKEATNRIGVGTLYRMMRGYSAGGYVGATPTGGGGEVNIVVNNNSSNAQATATTKTDSFGNRQIEIMVADMVNKAIATGKTDAAMRSSYNIRRSGK